MYIFNTLVRLSTDGLARWWSSVPIRDGPVPAERDPMRTITLVSFGFSLALAGSCSSSSSETADSSGSPLDVSDSSTSSSIPDSLSGTLDTETSINSIGDGELAADSQPPSCEELLSAQPTFEGYSGCVFEELCPGQLTCYFVDLSEPECIDIPNECTTIECVCESSICGMRACVPIGSMAACGDLPGTCTPGIAFGKADGCNQCICPSSGKRDQATCCTEDICPVFEPCAGLGCGAVCNPCQPGESECGENFYFCTDSGTCEVGPMEGIECTEG